jgi:predicted methyltransferase
MPFPTRTASAAVSLAAALVCASPYAAAQTDVGAQLDQILASDHRNPKNAARDKYRHPKEALMFFGIQPDMTVVEVWPSAGWWTEILAPFLRDRGIYNAAWYATPSKNAPEYAHRVEKGFDQMLAGRPDLYGKVTKTYLLAPEFVAVAPKGSVDMVLTFRNVHNWAKAGNAPAMFQVFHDLLKPGGVLGVVDHRAVPATPFETQVNSGYMTEEYVIDTAQKAGFRLVGGSEVNANPKDTKDHPKGVWTLPPVLALGDQDREKYLAIGESDRMTLKFVKP